MCALLTSSLAFCPILIKLRPVCYILSSFSNSVLNARIKDYIKNKLIFKSSNLKNKSDKTKTIIKHTEITFNELYTKAFEYYIKKIDWSHLIVGNSFSLRLFLEKKCPEYMLRSLAILFFHMFTWVSSNFLSFRAVFDADSKINFR